MMIIIKMMTKKAKLMMKIPNKAKVEVAKKMDLMRLQTMAQTIVTRKTTMIITKGTSFNKQKYFNFYLKIFLKQTYQKSKKRRGISWYHLKK